MAHTGDAVFLSDGRNTIRYRDLPAVVRTADHHLLTNLQGAGPDRHRDTKLPAWFGIDTTHRFEAVLWMACLWLRNIPFVPFSIHNPEPAALFRPDAIILTSPETKKNPLITELLAAREGNPTVASFLSTGLSQCLDAGAGTDPANLLQSAPITDPDAPFCGIATSGSSGRPKRVVLLRGNMMAAAQNAFRDMQRFPDSSKASRDDTSNAPGIHWDDYLWGNCLPLDHTGGLTIVFRALLSGTGIFLWDRFDEQTIISDLRAHPEIRRISLVPTMLKRLLAYGSGQGLQPPDRLDQVLLGGGPAGGDLITEARSAGWPVSFSYGMTETCGQVVAQEWIDVPAPGYDPPESAGKPFPGHELSIRDGAGRELPAGETGLLWVRGPQVFPGYLGDDRRIVPSVSGPDRDGWFDTGDYARLDDQGNLFIEARRTDLIVSGGENVNPVEVEQILRSFPQVRDAAVVGVSDDEWGQMVVAFIVPEKPGIFPVSLEDPEKLHDPAIRGEPAPKDAHLPDEERLALLANLESSVAKFSADNLKPHQRPKTFFFTTSIPRTALGKIERQKLQDKARGLPGGI